MSQAGNKQVAIIDYGMGNLFSVKQACESVGLRAVITFDSQELLGAQAAILPGVGSFGDAMDTLKRNDLVEPIKDFIASGKPFMGICLGMQLLFNQSQEFGKHSGLGVIAGEVAKFPVTVEANIRNKVPQIGWNKIKKPTDRDNGFWTKTLLQGLKEGEFMYFVHSYYCQPDNKEFNLSTTHYSGVEYCSSLMSNNVVAFQFHPEKSASRGMLIYNNFAKRVLEEARR